MHQATILSKHTPHHPPHVPQTSTHHGSEGLQTRAFALAGGRLAPALGKGHQIAPVSLTPGPSARLEDEPRVVPARPLIVEIEGLFGLAARGVAVRIHVGVGARAATTYYC